MPYICLRFSPIVNGCEVFIQVDTLRIKEDVQALNGHLERLNLTFEPATQAMADLPQVMSVRVSNHSVSSLKAVIADDGNFDIHPRCIMIE